MEWLTAGPACTLRRVTLSLAAPEPPLAGRYFVQTFGCQMNVHDSDRMEEVLVAHGWRPVASAEDADLVVFNTCSVREKAEQKLRSEVGKLAPLKQRRPDLVICVAGCVAQQEGEKLLKRIAHVDLVIGPDNLTELPALALAQRAGERPLARTVFDLEAPRFLAASPAPGAAPVSAFVTTMKGCDERCSFCIVPYTRGPERYRPVAEILSEVTRWVASGSREVVLLGQTVDSYQDPDLPPPETGDPDESQFPALLRLLASRVPAFDAAHPDRPGLARLRYTSPHPRHATASLARAHAEIDVLARHVHRPVQSGSDRVLRRMIRRYTRAEYVARAARLRAARPGLTLSTDVVVGFPGETEEDFLETLSVVREAEFTSLFGFTFSPRPHTPALRLVDDVPEQVKSERLARLFEVSEAQGRAHLASLVGTRQRVLIEGESPVRESVPLVTGRTERNEIVHLEAPEGRSSIGRLVDVEIARANKHSLAGRWTEEALAALPTAVVRPARRVLPLAPAPFSTRHA
jgi:tRNA-2-methylthio-N6-dimethylallyladenosine synthase